MEYNFFGFLVFALTISSFLISSHATRVGVTESNGSPISVTDFGAVGNGLQDDTQAFVKAWAVVCNTPGYAATLSVPAGKTFLLNAIVFQGPCRAASIHLEIRGRIVAPDNIAAWKGCAENTWIKIYNVGGLVIDGQGEIDGKGSIWWKNADTSTLDADDDDGNFQGIGLCKRPTGLSILNCKGFRLSNIAHRDSPGRHISIAGCDNSIMSNVQITAPENSPNTDGIDISQTSHFQIFDSYIATGDDCIAIGTGTSWLNITGVTCGPGHGISVGSLGRDGSEARVEEIHVKHCTFKNTQNGARIKTWVGGKGYARKITFEDIILIGAQNPIIIDQFYCDRHFTKVCQTTDVGPAVAVSDVLFRGFQGSSGSDIAITLKCSKGTPCENIRLENVKITPSNPKKTVTSSCQNVHGTVNTVTPPVPCLLGR